MKKELSITLLLVFSFALMSCEQSQVSPLKVSSAHTVFGNDDRTEITRESKRSRRVGRLQGYVSGTNKIIKCTATLVSRHHAVTAAHCLYDKNGNPLERLEFLPVYPESSKKKSYRAFVKKAWYKTSYNEMNELIINDEDLPPSFAKHDIALLELHYPVDPEKGIGGKIGWYGYFYTSPEESEYLDISLISLPRDKEEGTQWEESCVARNDGEIAKFKCDTYVGSSGSAILTIHGKTNTEIVVGINSLEGSYNNTAGMFTEEIFGELWRIIKNGLKGQSYDSKLFTQMDFDYSDRYYVHIGNGCWDKIQFAYYARELDYAWNVKGYYDLSPGDKKVLVRTSADYFYWYAHRSEVDTIWDGDDRYRDLYGDELGFTKKEFEHAGDIYIDFCNETY